MSRKFTLSKATSPTNSNKHFNSNSKTLHNSEVKQLNEFINSRSKTLDNEIDTLRKKLNLKSKDKIPTNFDFTSVNDKQSIGVNGYGLNSSNKLLNEKSFEKNKQDQNSYNNEKENYNDNTQHKPVEQAGLKTLFSRMKISEYFDLLIYSIILIFFVFRNG